MLAVLAALMVTGCDGADPAATSPSPTGGPVTEVVRPHFEGARPVRLAVGQILLGSGCQADTAPEWVCDPEADRTYRRFGDPLEVTLREARMDLVGGGTSWTVTLRFDPRDRQAVVATREDARGMGAFVVLLDSDEQVLAAAAVPDVGRGVIRLSQLDKREAWRTVERLAAK